MIHRHGDSRRVRHSYLKQRSPATDSPGLKRQCAGPGPRAGVPAPRQHKRNVNKKTEYSPNLRPEKRRPARRALGRRRLRARPTSPPAY
ncbi:hypothetical protein EVAR_17390_1 [Eumeta japonica]|uniref:Uncharacterized protein n=1 Tax=Eumeta variegata TaxID=151549 RepID=A0A4C1VA63_EUMVA|nr:hypothetical protein EVAR_17390_1 [Eumeta japonica]